MATTFDFHTDLIYTKHCGKLVKVALYAYTYTKAYTVVNPIEAHMGGIPITRHWRKMEEF